MSPAIDVNKELLEISVFCKRGKCKIYFEADEATTAKRAAHNKGQMKIKGNRPVNNSYENNLFFDYLFVPKLFVIDHKSFSYYYFLFLI